MATDCCSACGSKKLTPGAAAFNVRPVSWLALAVGMLIFGPGLLQAVLSWASRLFWIVFAPVERMLITLAILSFFFAPLLNEDGRARLGAALMRVFRALGILTCRFIQAICNILYRIVQKQSDRPKSKQ